MLQGQPVDTLPLRKLDASLKKTMQSPNISVDDFETEMLASRIRFMTCGVLPLVAGLLSGVQNQRQSLLSKTASLLNADTFYQPVIFIQFTTVQMAFTYKIKLILITHRH